MKRSYYDRMKEEHRCTNCGAQLRGSRRDKTTCKKCSDKRKKYTAEYYSKHREYCSKHKLCPRCGENKLFGDEKLCPECRAVMWTYNVRYVAEHPESLERKNQKAREQRQIRIENNLCTFCGQPLEDLRYKACIKCRVANMLRTRRSRANQARG